MNTFAQTNAVCDAVSVRRPARLRDRRTIEVVALPADSLPAEPMLSSALAGASPGYFLYTFTLIGSQVVTRMIEGELVVSFFLNCSSANRVHYPARQVVASRIIGRCGDADLVELTIAYGHRS